MRPVVLAVALVALAVPPVAAQPVSLSPEQARRYRSLELEVVVMEQGRQRVVSRGFGNADVYDASRRWWEGYAGGQQLDEAAFYRHAGADNLADFVEGRRRGGWIAVGLGAVGLVAGAVLFSSAEGDELTTRLSTSEQVGLGVAATGIAVSVVGYFRAVRPNHTSIRQAAETARTFNAALEQAVRERR